MSEEKKDKEQTEETVANEETSVSCEELLAQKDEELSKSKEQYQRLLAEYDNFKKRTIKEKEAIYTDSVKDTVAELLPVIDNLIRAVDAFSDKECEECRGVAMVLRQTEEIFAKLGVSEIKSVGEKFNPEFHNAVMHVEDDSGEESIVVEEFQKGYIYKDKVIRYSMVKVAN